MCGRFNLHDNPYLRLLLEYLGLPDAQPMFRDDIPPCEKISIVRETQAGRRLDAAVWWLFLDPATLKPGRYTSFNSRWDKLDDRRGISYKPFRQSRCIIPASAFCEGLGDRKTYHKIEAVDAAIAFGGLYREHLRPDTGEIVLSASIITLGGLPEWKDIHADSMPLMLDYRDTALIDRWLDPTFQDVDFFRPLLEPRLTFSQRITPIDRPSTWNPVGESYLIA